MQGAATTFEEPRKNKKRKSASVLVAEKRAKKRAARALADLSRFDSDSSDADERLMLQPAPAAVSPPSSEPTEAHAAPQAAAVLELERPRVSAEDSAAAAGQVNATDAYQLEAEGQSSPPEPRTRESPGYETQVPTQLPDSGAEDERAASGDGAERDDQSSGGSASDESAAEQSESESSGSDAQPGADTDGRSAEGGNSFATAFAKVMGRRIADDAEVPILAGRRKLLAKKLHAQEQADRASVERRKERTQVRERNHVKPPAHADAKERALIKLATRGVVRLFNAVQKAQEARQEALGSGRRASKGASEIGRAAFIKELKGMAASGASPAAAQEAMEHTALAGGPALGRAAEHGTPGWSVLRDDFILERPTARGFDRTQADTRHDEGSQDESDD